MGRGLPPSWRDHEDRPVAAPTPPGPDRPAFYTAIGDFQGESYRRNAFARATSHEVAVLSGVLQLRSGSRLLDVGCGNGRHLRALAETGIVGVGVDVSPALVRAAVEAAERDGVGDRLQFVCADARSLPPEVAEADFDAAMSVCQGGFGTGPATDRRVLDGLARAVRTGGRVVFTAFHALFAARHLAPGDAYDVVSGVHHQRTEVRGPDGTAETFDLWTVAYTVGEAVALAEDVGLDVESVRGVEPGRYDTSGVALDDPEILVVARRR